MSNYRASIRDNLLVTMGSRAAYMDASKDIELPSGSRGEDILANFCAKKVDEYIARSKEEDLIFDEFIETALSERFPVENA